MPDQQPPGPAITSRLGGNLSQLRGDFLGFLLNTAQTYGDVTHFRAGPQHMYLLNHPDLIYDVLVKRAAIFYKTDSTKKLLGKFIGDGLISLEGDFHRTHRRLMQPAFHKTRIETYTRSMVAQTEQHISRWQTGAEYDIAQEMNELTLEIVANALFSVELKSTAKEIAHAMETFADSLNLRMRNPLPLPDWVPTKGNRNQRDAIKTLDAILIPLIRERRASGEDKGDLLSMLLMAVDEDGKTRLSDKEVRDELMTMFFAGYETTSHTLAWIWYLLSQNPEAEAKLYAELREVIGDRAPTVDDLPRLTYMALVIKETLRLYPTAWLFDRQPTEDVQLGGFTVPKGRTIFISPYTLHRDSRFFDAPEQFRPERFTENFEERTPRYAYIPFGGGPRVCIGQAFAQIEMSMILATIAQKYRLSLVEGQQIISEASATLKPKFGLNMMAKVNTSS